MVACYKHPPLGPFPFFLLWKRPVRPYNPLRTLWACAPRRAHAVRVLMLRAPALTQELAGTAHYDVMRELLATTEAKVMLAIDEYNELFQMSHWHYMDDKASTGSFVFVACGETASRENDW